jgi:hypothetical protein
MRARGHVDVAVDVIGPPVEKNQGRTAGRTDVGVSDVQDAAVDLLQCKE